MDTIIHHHFKGGEMNANIGLFGFFLTVFSFISSQVLGLLYWFGRLKVETLQEIALYITIIVGCLTIMWHLGNMLMKEQEFRQALKKKLKQIFKK